ncbi:PepSY domain-containing protein [Nonomuraea longispora]|uniref:PepSY domain-containing protein n=1 Tax=Nonomuraea longispora TaxID=1848320 RepID=A0A4R4NH40_9ACTN|nr:PepSY domain-containing protein [Nonomuraea longispora]TDC08339.1 PepSY domain-containing protein [Nonomuraea longispora]
MTSSDLSSAPATQPPAQRGATWAALRPLVLRLHFYAGMLVAPFLLIAATTGFLYAASVQIEKIVYRYELTAPAAQTRLPLAQQIEAARAARPDGKVSAVQPAAEAGSTTRVLLDVPGLAPSTRLAVFVDPHTAQVRGTLESYGSSGALPVRAWISNLHRHLHLGEPGRVYSELAASWLWVVALGGLLMWAGRRRTRRRQLVLPERGVAGSRRLLSWHGSVGLWVVLGLFFLSATGLTWSTYAGANVGELRAALGWTTPEISTASGGHAGHAPGDHQPAAASAISADQVAQTARSEGLSGPLEIAWPAETGGPYVVKEIDNQWPVRLDQIAVDPATGQVTARLPFASYSPAAKLATWGIDAHMGLLFGLANQLLLMGVAAGLITLIVLGYRMWWRRRPTGGPAAPPARGAWRQVPRAALAPPALLAVGVCVFLPLMGISLAVFLVIDILLGRRART